VSYYVIIATAGHDTTSSSTAGAMWALAERPAEFAKLKASLGLIPGLVDDRSAGRRPSAISCARPPPTRSCAASPSPRGLADVVLSVRQSRRRGVRGSVRIPDGAQPNRHLAFGYGAHLCLGQHLAKMEMRILWEELIPCLESLELGGVPQLSEASFVNGPKKLPIRYKFA